MIVRIVLLFLLLNNKKTIFSFHAIQNLPFYNVINSGLHLHKPAKEFTGHIVCASGQMYLMYF